MESVSVNTFGLEHSFPVPGLNMRRYHRIAAAALHPPVRRYVLLSTSQFQIGTGAPAIIALVEDVHGVGPAISVPSGMR